MFVSGLAASAQFRPAPTPDQWEPTIKKYEEATNANPSLKGGVVFYGAGVISRWNLDESFPDLKGAVVKRGFGGAEMADYARYAQRLILPLVPRAVVLYPGENEIVRGAAVGTVLSGFRQLYDSVHTALPQTRIILIGLRPVPYRWQWIDEIRKANTLLQPFCELQTHCVYVDVHPDTIGANGLAKPELFIDGEHMTPEGYRLWTRLVRRHL
jgi:lysophospholipase L1-like esterase